MGHVLNNTIQDILARRARQEGKSVLWLPGTDHAGIATQTKVEQALAKEGKSRENWVGITFWNMHASGETNMEESFSNNCKNSDVPVIGTGMFTLWMMIIPRRF